MSTGTIANQRLSTHQGLLYEVLGGPEAVGRVNGATIALPFSSDMEQI